jgi:NADP-dependent 3-hydroxy acid dehydrogenase YdfG
VEDHLSFGPNKSSALAGKAILVTGASSGIGEAVAKAAAERGASVAISARTTSRLETLASEIEAMEYSVKILPTDLRDRAQIREMIEGTIDAFGGLDVLVNNAGVGHWKAISDADIDRWQDEIEVNLLASMYATRFAVEFMLKEQTGHIVFVSSLSGRFPGPEYPSYTASKAGLNAFADSIMFDLRRKGIKVTLIEPGAVDTAMQDENERGLDNLLCPFDVADAVVYALTRPDHVCISNIALLRSGNTEES